MRTFTEYMEENEWSWSYVWTSQDSEDLDTTDPTDDDVEKSMIEIVGDLQNHPDYKLPDYISIDFTALGDTGLIPYSFHVKSKSDNPDEFGGRDYELDFQPSVTNKDNVFIPGISKIIASYHYHQ